MENLLSLRKKIEEINLEILNLLNKRLEIALQIKKIKELENLPLYDSDRENKMLMQLLEQNAGPLSSEEVTYFFKMIFQSSLNRMLKDGN